MRGSSPIRSVLPLRHRVAAGLVALAQLVSATGLPVPAAAAKDPTSAPFPCQSRPCGCRTAQQCWAGACHCFTMRQKLAWAAERGLTPPAHAVRLAAAEAATNDAADAAGSSACCCCKPKSPPGRPACCPAPADPPADQTPPASAGPRWVIGVFALGCHGQPQAGPVAGPPAVPADASPFALEAPLRCGTVPLLSATSVVRPSTPPTPPPRSV